MTRYRLRPRARRDLEAIWDYSAPTWGAAQAEIYLRMIQRAFEALSLDPQLGRACDDIRLGYRKYLAGSHVIFYRFDAKRIDIVRILHARMDFDRHI